MRKKKSRRKVSTQQPSKSRLSRPRANRIVTDYDWERHCQGIFEHAERAYRSGNQLALWDVVVFCEQANVAKPAWARAGLIRHAYEQAAGQQKKIGRRPNLLRDAYILESVNFWCEQMIQPKSGKARHFSKRLAYKAVKRELAADGMNLSLEAVKTAYERAKKRQETGKPYYSPMFSEIRKSR